VNQDARPRVLNILLNLRGIGPIRRDHAHIDPIDWEDTRTRDGTIVTHCRRCGAFIGRRPAEVTKRTNRGSR
jgi:hypothetical protein